MSLPEFQMISLDLETSTDNPETGTILSVGAVAIVPQSAFGWHQYYREVKHEGPVTITPEALRVNGFDVSKLDQRGMTLSEIDEDLSKWLRMATTWIAEPLKPVPLGRNVVGFDMPFVRKYLPESAKMLGYRGIDLNALAYTEAERANMAYKNVKRDMVRNGTAFANCHCGKPAPGDWQYVDEHTVDVGAHHALWDAWSNWGCWNYFNPGREIKPGRKVHGPNNVV
jgi:hypothetical protein